ncbi:MAG: P-loop NTPase [Actinomycetota bacterium]|nr:P-loop NTPase [Actinomycetota bacterium]
MQMADGTPETREATRVARATGGSSGAPRPVLVLEHDPELVDAVADALGDALGGRYEVRAISNADPLTGLALADRAVVVLGPASSDRDTIARVGDIARSRPGLGALVLVERASADLLRTALRAGIDDALEMSSAPDDLLEAVDALWSRLEVSRVSSNGQHPGRPGLATVTTVFSPKGGVGKSVVAINLAVALARGAEKPVAILDLDLQFGDVAVMLRLQPVHTIVEAAAAGDQLDEVLMSSLVARHDPSGVLVLAAPTTPSAADQIRPKDMLTILGVLRTMCSHVVIDTPPHLDEVVLQAVSESDDVAFVVGMDVPSVKNARLGLQAFELVQLPLEKVVLVLNRADSKVHLAVRDVERSLQVKVDVNLPSEALVPESVNEGVPAILRSPKARFSSKIEALARLVVERTSARSGTGRP